MATAKDVAYTLEAVKKLKKGQGILGPEFFGCCNTGSRPLIFRAHTGNFPWIVTAWDLDMDEARQHNLFRNNADKRVIPAGGGKNKLRQCWYYKSARDAFGKWVYLVGLRVDENKRMLEEARTARERLKKNPTDVEAALKLGDLGLL